MMYIPKDNPEVDSLYTSGELKNIKAQEKRKAKVEVEKALKHWFVTSFLSLPLCSRKALWG